MFGSTPQKSVVLSGIQPSGRLHLGNYLGALKNFVELQNSGKYQGYFMIADLHSLTETYTPDEKRKQVFDLCASYLAAGLDGKKSTLFIQSRIPAHAELAWILNTITPMGELERMTQFKEKSGLSILKNAIGANTIKIKVVAPLNNDPILHTIESSDFGNIVIPANANPEQISAIILDHIIKQMEKRGVSNVGLFDYPVLMAADILLYNAAVIPVGDDQDQHLELTRTLARKFNNRFGQTFIEPKALHTPVPRLMSLSDPARKMSKSEPTGCLFLDDDEATTTKKIMSAVTDSGSEVKFDEINKPGIANLLTIMSAMTGKTIPQLETEFAGKQYGAFKAAVAESVNTALAPMRAKKAELMKNPKKVLSAFSDGSKKANKVATAKLTEVYKKMGLV